MKFRALAFLFAFLLSAGLVSAEDKTKAKQPTLVVKLKSLDGLMDDLQYVATLAGQGEEAKQFKLLFESVVGEEGLEGVSTKKPIGLYGTLDADIEKSQVVLMLPLADEKAFLATLKRFEFEPKKGQNGIYSFFPEGSPVEIFFTFADDYVYATVGSEKAIEKKNRRNPKSFLKAEEIGTAQVSLNLADIPDEYRDLISGQVALIVADQSEKKEGEKDIEHKVRKEVLENLAKHFEVFLEGAGTLNLKLNIDQKKEKISLNFDLGAKAKSELETVFKDMGSVQSFVAGIIGDSSVISAAFRADLPKWVSSLAQQFFGMFKAEAMKNAENEIMEKYFKKAFQALTPASKMKEIDLAFSINGPNKAGLYTAIAGARVNGAKGIEKVIREVMKEQNFLPGEVKALLTVDYASVGDVKIHRINLGNQIDAETQKVLGKSDIYVAFKKNSIFVAMGADAVDTLKKAVKCKPVTATFAQLNVSIAKLAPVLEGQRKGAAKAAEEIFGKEPKGDKISVTLKGGSKLEGSINVDARLIKFFAALEKLTNNDKGEGAIIGIE